MRRIMRNGKSLVAAACLLGASLLATAALLGKSSQEEHRWIPMNESLEAVLALPEGEWQSRTDNGSVAGAETVNKPAEDGAGESSDSEAGTVDGDKAAAGGESGSADADGLIDINRASALQLDGLKGIGPAKAQAIVDDREENGPFASVEELLRVKGIGEKLLASIKESVVALP
ncbi:helix-hairpin-helix domain-containing protein [Paenibacillus sp. LHD-117]|uniref:ComEA family DNA-binding protein n=1 Tax=Paenibacillus sp. LHD-117 TaxID=3071412 RepID=UPI0027E0C50D|nr:helix-hairpin-helix domain-containing protein [Paenibacillus sp. LHD-117]MDQ6423322.1 helix-hairpin-helix domain-containing protein [Paenibacillus sp. LHD-117]